MSSYTGTYSQTDAKYLGSKKAADLKQLQLFYGEPSDAHIEKYIYEFVILLKDGYLESCSYGFKRNGIYIAGVDYKISGFSGIDDNPGRVPAGANITGATWGSFLEKSSKFFGLTAVQQKQIEDSLPIKRVGSPDPRVGAGSTMDKSYGSGDVEIKRTIFK